MGEGSGELEEDGTVKPLPPRWWGLRPWRRHSTILMVVGILFMFVGYAYISAPASEMRERSLHVILQWAPLQFWGSLFIAAGALAVVSTRWPPLTETWGYMVVTGLSAGWAATYLTGILFFHAPASGWTQVFLWGVLAFMWYAISGFPNPERPADVEE